MFIFGYLFLAVAKILHIVINLYIFLIIVDTILSWLNLNNYNEYARFISRLVEPYLSIFRNLIPRFSALDLTPLFGILALYFIDEFFVNVIREMGQLFL